MRIALPIGMVATLLALALAEVRQTQQESCELEIVQTPGQQTHYTTLSDGGTRIDLGGGVEATCGTKWLRADSASYYRERGLLYLIGGVEYTEEGRRLDADRATYYEREGWVHCEGNVRLTSADGRSTLSGPVVDYFPASDTSAQERIYAPERSHLTFHTGAPGAADSAAFDVDADRMHIYGDSIMAGAGEVVAVRGDLIAYSDTMDLNLTSGHLWLLGDPDVTAGDMALTGDSILVLLEQNQVREIEAWPQAAARGQEMVLTAPLLRFFVANDEIERAVASAGDSARTGAVDSPDRPPWAESESRDYSVVADSIEILRPAGQLDRVIAIERAQAKTRHPVDPADPVLGYDWLVGDTITGYFVPGDSLSTDPQEAELSRLVASGNARALYHILDQSSEGGAESGTDHPGINYVIGRVVTLWLRGGEVDSALVDGPATGLYLEPLPQRPAADTAAAADSLGKVVPDTVRAVGDTTQTLQPRSGSG